MTKPVDGGVRSLPSEWHKRFAALHDPDPLVAMAAAEAIRDLAIAGGNRVVVVSACLLGEPVRYDAGHKFASTAIQVVQNDPNAIVVPLCPELLAGMGCPRPAISYRVGDGLTLAQGLPTQVVDEHANDHTEALARGAQLAESLAVTAGADMALLKERSPSCGVTQVHGAAGPRSGMGAFAARLAAHHLTLLTEDSFSGADRAPTPDPDDDEASPGSHF